MTKKDFDNTEELNRDEALSAEPREESQGTDKVQMTREEYEQLEARLKELEALREKFLRVAADFENAKKRLMKERDEFIKFSQESLIRSLLPVLDNFERALSHAGDSEREGGNKMAGILAGIQMVQKQLEEILKAEGLRRVESVGKVFDPRCHEAVAYVHEPGKPDEIVEEVEAGYYLHERLLRAAKVKIRLAPEDASPEAGSSHPHESRDVSDEEQDEIT